MFVSIYPYNLIATTTYICRPYDNSVIHANRKLKKKRGGGNSVPLAPVVWVKNCDITN
jgi:hypothetical protein